MNSTAQSIDRDSQAVVDLFKERFDALSLTVGPIGNIYIVFMQDLVVHFSGILMQRTAQEHYPGTVEFPFVTKEYAMSPYLVGAQNLGNSDHPRGFKSWLRRLPLSRVSLGEALPFGYRQDYLPAKLINLLGSHKPFTAAYLPQRNKQIQELLDCINELCRLYGIANSNLVNQNWRQYAQWHTTAEQTDLHEHGLLLGSRNNLQNRKLAVNYMQQGKEVVAVSHGEVANSVMDEPPFGYSERTLCTTLIDYGDFDNDGQYNVPLILPKQRFYRSAPVARSVHRPADDIRPSNRHRYRALYIPTTYAGNYVYGPFHVYEDALYYRWQRSLFEKFPHLTLKAHPKSWSEPPLGISVDRRPLEECILDYELLVFDYFATGSMLALMSDKPVIYFDIGLRRLHPIFMQDIKNRCEYAKIDLDGDIGNQVTGALEKFWSADTTQTNTLIAQYALCEKSQFDWLDLFKSVARGASPSWQ